MQDNKAPYHYVNVKPHVEANGNNGHTNGSRASLIHLARNGHLTCCGLDRAFFGGAIVASKVSEANCRNCLRISFRTLTHETRSEVGAEASPDNHDIVGNIDGNGKRRARRTCSNAIRI